MFDFKPKISSRSALLDCIRALAVIMVVIFHVTVTDLGGVVLGPDGLDAAGAWFQRYGFLGVDIFFPLSGFLITSFLLKFSGNQAIGTFFLRRFFRIVPLYMLALVVFAAGAIVTGVEADLLDRMWINATFLTGWYVFFEGRSTVPYTITWSLSVEEFAYILFGLAAWMLRKNFVALLWGLTAFSIILRLYLNVQDAVDIYYFPPARLDSIAIGGLVAAAHYYNKRPLLWLTGGLALAFAIGFLDGPFRPTMLFLKLTLGTCIVISLIQSYALKFRSPLTFPFAVIGFYSYFIYLFHYFVIFGLDMVLGVVGLQIGVWPFSLAVIALTTGAGYLSYALFEGPLMTLGRRLEPRAAAGMHPVTPPSVQEPAK